MLPETRDFAVTSCLRPGQEPGRPRHGTWHMTRPLSGRSTTQPTDATKTASASPRRFSTATLEGGETPLATSPPGSFNVSAPPPAARPATSVLNWLSASLRHTTVIPRVPFCDVFAWQPPLPFPGDETTGGQLGMILTPMNGPSLGPTQG